MEILLCNYRVSDLVFKYVQSLRNQLYRQTINTYFARNLSMEDSEEVTYYELPPFIAQGVILHLYTLVDNIFTVVPQLASNPSFAEDNIKLKAKMKATDPEYPLMLTYLECLVMCEMMSIIKFYYKHAVLPNTEGKENLSEQDIASREMYDEVMQKIIEITDDVFLVFPLIKEPFYQMETDEKKQKEEAKTLGLNKKKKVVYFSLANDLVSHHISSLFAFFEYLIIYGTSNFSERVREADFCCITEIKETKKIFERSLKATKKNKDYETKFSLREVVVILMINNIFQKTYFSDGGDDLHKIFVDSVSHYSEVTATEMRDHMLRMAKSLEDNFCSEELSIKGLKEAMKPIFDFPV